VAVVVSDAILRITQFFRLGSIEAVMVSFWIVDPTSVLTDLTDSEAAFMIAEHWDTNVGQFTLNTNAVYYRTLIEKAPEFYDFVENVFDRPGGQAGDAAPSFVAGQIRQLVATRQTRGGYKRLPFLIEANVSGNEFDTTPVIREGIEAIYGNQWVVTDLAYPDNTIRLNPVIIGRTNMGTPEVPDYQLDFTKVNPVVSASLARVTHQNSRDT
jgi:hypothetical protein